MLLLAHSSYILSHLHYLESDMWAPIVKMDPSATMFILQKMSLKLVHM